MPFPRKTATALVRTLILSNPSANLKPDSRDESARTLIFIEEDILVTSIKDNEIKQPSSASLSLIDDASMFIQMQLALRSFLETYDRVYSPRGYQDAALAECARAARLAVKELASNLDS